MLSACNKDEGETLSLREQRDVLLTACREFVSAWDKEIEGDLIDCAHGMALDAIDMTELSIKAA